MRTKVKDQNGNIYSVFSIDDGITTCAPESEWDNKLGDFDPCFCNFERIPSDELIELDVFGEEIPKSQ